MRGREAGFAAAVEAAGQRYTRLDWHAAVQKNARRPMAAWLVRQLRRLPKPLGVMGQSDRRAYSVITACEAAKLTVPDQVAVVGVDNEPYTCGPPRTKWFASPTNAGSPAASNSAGRSPG